ncbi:hypothetical protein Ddc_18736 [Ditylenchus destructor]|nr:hypothetical protein Ddc_18736 [Ditylenchus destructor]
MLPFMSKSVRFDWTIFEVNSSLTGAMENFAHLWTGQTLEIKHGHDTITPSSPNESNNLLNFVERLSKYNSRTQLVCFSSCHFQRTHIGKIRESFSNSKETHAWKLIIVEEELYGRQDFIEFRDENLLTKDVLEYRVPDNQLKEDLCASLRIPPWRDLWILERKPL